jgi:sec-independent protein translocase protein TatB
MFNVGGGEIIVVLLIALIVLGPDRLPEYTRKAAKAAGELRRLSNGFQSEMRNAMNVTDDTPTVAPTAAPTVDPVSGPRLLPPPSTNPATSAADDGPAPAGADAPAAPAGDDSPASGTSAA